jgi:uncharacterized repeat protein (TIGR03803 family)
MDPKGNLYGTTNNGGTLNLGTIFKLDPTGKKVAQYSFAGGAGGAHPYAGIIRDAAGNLYGTTQSGGDMSQKSCSQGCGTVFELKTNHTLNVLHCFTVSDGANPTGPLFRDSAGNLYGTTLNGGDNNYGTVFEVNSAGAFILLHSFTSADGSTPISGLVRDGAGNLYGTTNYGGGGDQGTVFKLIP